MTWSVEETGIVKWFEADTVGVTHSYGGHIENSREEERVRKVYAPGHKGIIRLTIKTFAFVSIEEVLP